MPTPLTRRRLAQAIAVAALSVPLTGCLSYLNLTPEPELDKGSLRSKAMLANINALRTSKGLPSLVIDPAAERAASYQAKRMANAGRMEHLLYPGDDFAKRVTSAGVRLAAAENIATGQSDSEEAFKAWVNSPRHLANMLGPYKGFGVAVATGNADGGRTYWAMVLSN